MIYFTSDWHLGHKNVIHSCERPFNSLRQMERTLIKNYNNVVSNKDTVYFLGDMFFYTKASEIKNIVSKLNGKKILIKGNHDKKGASAFESYGFDLVLEEAKIMMNGNRVVLSHFPYWLCDEFQDERYKDKRPQDMGEWLLHGHTHDRKKLNLNKRMIHVGVDAWNFKPVSISKISSIMALGNKYENN